MVKCCQPKDKDSFGRTIVLVLIFFLFLYSFQVPGLPFGSVIPALGVMAFYLVISICRGNTVEKLKTSKMVRQYWWWNVFLLVYVSLLLQFFGAGDGVTPLNDYLYMLIILPVFYVSSLFIIRDLEDIMRILYVGVIIQSIIIIAAVLIPSLSVALYLLIPDGGYNTDHFGGLDMITEYGYHIGLGVFTSAGSLKMAIGQIGASYFLIRSRGPKLFYHIVFFLLITIATSLVSRTGLLISIVGLMSVFIAKWKQSGNRAIGYVSLVLLAIIVGYFVVSCFFSTNFLEETFQRVIYTAENGIKDTYLKGYTGEGGNNSIPPLSLNTMVGLGITYGESGSGVTTITDGGFMRNYSAMGLIVAIINYLLIFNFFIKQYHASRFYKGIIVFMFFLLLIGEFKEYFIYYISPMCFIFLIFGFIENEEACAVIQSN